MNKDKAAILGYSRNPKEWDKLLEIACHRPTGSIRAGNISNRAFASFSGTHLKAPNLLENGLLMNIDTSEKLAVLFMTQPTYLPWVGIFKAIALSDTYVFYDDTQFVRHSWQNRNRVLDPIKREAVMLTVPVAKHNRETAILDMKVADPGFYVDHVSKLRAWYKRAPFLEPTLDVLMDVYSKRHTRLVDLTAGLTMALARHLGLSASYRYAHEFDIHGDKYTRPLAFARSLGSPVYLSGERARDYTNVGAFVESGIKIEFLRFTHPEYKQRCEPFIPYLSIVDMLINIGPQESAAIIESIQLEPDEDIVVAS